MSAVRATALATTVVRMSVFLALMLTLTQSVFAQLPAGPDANPRKRMDCATDGMIRNDNRSCVAVESYLSTGSNDIYWVSQSGGNDSNPGTKSRPWKTIARANRTGQLRAGDAVIIRGGTYRETIAPTSEGRNGARISFVAYPGENVVISGAVPMNSGWTLHSGRIYKHAYNDSWDASCPYRSCDESYWRREIVAANGKLLKQVSSLSEMGPGTYFVNGNPPNTSPSNMFVWFPSGAAPGNFNIEIGKLPILFQPSQSPETCSGGDQGYYRLIGLTFRYAVNKYQRGAVCPGTQGSLIEEVTVEKTSSYGMRAAGANHTFRGNTLQDNGQAGIGGGCDHCVLEYNASLRNNWRDFFFGFEQGGGKFAKARNTTIRYHLAKDNNGAGMWFDGDNTYNVVESSMFVDNVGAGVFMEMNSKYNTLRNNLFYGTKYQKWTGAGILSHATSYNTYEHNTIMNNEGIGLWIRRDPGNRAPEGHNKIYNNLFINNGTSNSTSSSVFKYEIFVCSNDNQLNGNQYWTHTDNQTFFYGPTRYAGDNISTWRSLTKQEGKAGLLNPSKAVVENRHSFTGFRLTTNSQALGKGIALPTNLAVTLDFFGSDRPLIAPDAGAHERAGGTNSLEVTEAVQTLEKAVDPSVPDHFALESNYPNPFNPQTTIKYQLAETAPVLLEVFDVAGRRVATLVDETQSASVYQVVFDAKDLPSGVYLYRLQAGSFVQTSKMILVK